MIIYIGHRCLIAHGYIPVQTCSGDVEMIPNAVCLDPSCKKHTVWHGGKWWETLEYKWPSGFYIGGAYY